MKEYLILGGTGTVGSELVRLLLQQGKQVHVLTRSQDKVASLPDGTAGVVGDLQNPGDYNTIFSDAQHVFLLNPVAPTELQEGLAAINEAKRVGAKRMVYMSVHNVERGAHIPHFASKLVIEQALAESGIPYTIIRPSSFYQNDIWLKDAILQYHLYPQPLGDVGVSRVDVRDIAKAAMHALTQPGHEGKTYTLVGPEKLTGADCANAFSEALGQKINYGGNDLDAWEQQALQMMPGWMVYDFKLMYELFQREGLYATDQQAQETRTILGEEPRRFQDFVQEAVASWT